MVFKGKPILFSLGVLLALPYLKTETEWKSGTGHSVDKNEEMRVANAYGKLPLYFIENTGQLTDKVEFYERGRGHSLFLTDESICLSLKQA